MPSETSGRVAYTNLMIHVLTIAFACIYPGIGVHFLTNL